MNRLLILLVLSLTIVSSAFAQRDWTEESNDLYYHNGTERVYIEAAQGAAIYFPSGTTIGNISDLQADHPSAKISQRKSMVVIKDNVGQDLKSEQGRQNFMNRYGLGRAGATRVLPNFKVDEHSAWFTEKITVKVSKGVDLSTLRRALAGSQAVLRDNVKYGIYTIEVKDLENQLSVIQNLYESGLIEWGQPDFVVTVNHTNDPLYGEQFQMHNTGAVIDGVATTADIDLDAPEAWAITKGSPTIKVSVIDDGVEAHEDLPTIVGGYTPLNGGNGTPDASGAHGESCAGIIAALHDNNLGVKGMAPNVQLQTVNIFAGNESINDLADAFYWSVNNGADVLSNSWGFPNLCQNNPYPALTDAINDAAINGRGGKGCVIIFAAGNDGNTCVSYPGRLASVVAVGAIGANGVPSYYTNSGSTLDVVAPSSDQTWGVRTTDREGSAGYGSGNYTTSFGGTSAACPAVAGASALILSVNPDLTGPQVHDLLEQTADDMGSSGFDNTYGYGRVNAYAAVVAAQGGGGGGGGGGSCNDVEGTLTIVTDSYPAETTWTITDDAGATVASGGPYANTNTTYTEDLCLPDGCYSFTINDSYGDGICCTYGNGSYSLTSGGSTLASGGAFTSTETTSFDLGAGCGGGGGGGGGGGSCTSVTIDSNDFEGGLGIWNDGGSDCRRSVNDAAYANSGSYCVRLRDNTSTSVMTTDNLNLDGFEEVTIDFSYLGVSMETGEDFWLQASTDGGATYQTLSTWASGTDFSNNVREDESVTITGTFNSTVRFRFRCDASANADRMYIDDVVMTGCTTGSLLTNEEKLNTFASLNEVATPIANLTRNGLKLFPNPTSDKININLQLVNPEVGKIQVYVMDVMGRLVHTRTLEATEISRFTIDVTDFADGFYHLTIVNAEERLTKTFVVAN